MNQYPYFLYPAICELKRNSDPEREAALRQFIAANVGQREALLRLIGDLDESLLNFYPAAEEQPVSVDASIDTFISRYSSKGGPYTPPALIPEEEEKPTPVPEEKEEPLPLPDEKEEPLPLPEEIEEPVPEEKPLPATEKKEEPIVEENPEDIMKRVKELVKKRDYDGAIEIMEAFYLNNPKKSVYFADQIRFLRKLKLNDSKK